MTWPPNGVNNYVVLALRQMNDFISGDSRPTTMIEYISGSQVHEV